eukprot:c8085_g1_i2 orf=70-270(+)
MNYPLLTHYLEIAIHGSLEHVILATYLSTNLVTCSHRDLTPNPPSSFLIVHISHCTETIFKSPPLC